VGQTSLVQTTELVLDGERSVELATVGEDDARPVLYFHSPATAAEELIDAEAIAIAAGVRMIALRRPSVGCDKPADFMKAVADCVDAVLVQLGVGPVPVLGWSGGAPYALCAATHLGARVSSIGLVSPVPGPLTGPKAITNQSERLRQVADSTASSDWISGPAVLRDYQAISGPWPFEVSSTTQHVSIWSPHGDEIVPPNLLVELQQNLDRATLYEVEGSHGWLTDNWSTVLESL